ncbi:X-prolyl-dipeptidyl aminopeptidase [Streptomyces sp. NRRL F-4489]|nr:X-prolyl-dipeptidyl aminopeptidase [Streptomyces sp. NRRL F-4489]
MRRGQPHTPWTTLVGAAVLALLALLTGPPAASAAPAPRESRPVYSYAHAIRETVWVDTGLDGDADGRPDRVAADIIRPAEPARQGRRIPAIMDASPYYSCCGRGNESQKKTYDDRGRPAGFPLFYDNYFVPRGYATVLVDLAGTNRSDGCVDVGGRSDIQSAKAVIDWLNGRARGYTARTGGSPVTAGWSNGRTGMIGKSWDATIANGVAATGVPGLETIVPISGISSWYDYYFAQGAPLYDGGPDQLAAAVESPGAHKNCAAVQQKLKDGAPRTGDWTALWTERDYVRAAAKVRASVFLVHGMQDLNVRTQHVGQWWDALARHGVPRKIWLSQTGHVDPFDYRRGAWVDTLHRWFDHYLMGYRNGIERAPMADVERAPDTWATDARWPAPGTAPVTVHPRPGTAAGPGGLGTRPAPAGRTAAFTDDPAHGEADWAAALDRATPDKAGFTTGPLTAPLRLSGAGTVTVTATPSTTSAHLSAVLVDIGPDTIRNYAGDGEGIRTLTRATCWGAGTPADTGCFKETAADTRPVGFTVFSRGWADLGHATDPHHGHPLTPGTPYTLTLRLAASDHVVPAGHRLALIVAGTDANLIDPPASRPTLTLDLARTAARLPVTGGGPAWARATGSDGGAVGGTAGTGPVGIAPPVGLSRMPYAD